MALYHIPLIIQNDQHELIRGTGIRLRSNDGGSKSKTSPTRMKRLSPKVFPRRLGHLSGRLHNVVQLWVELKEDVFTLHVKATHDDRLVERSDQVSPPLALVTLEIWYGACISSSESLSSKK